METSFASHKIRGEGNLPTLYKPQEDKIMVKVDYYRAEVKYTGAFEEYTLEDWKKMAIGKQNSGVDCYEFTNEETEEFAKVVDGKFLVENRFPCNKLAYVEWAYIREEDED